MASIRFLNTDLDIRSREDPLPLVEGLRRGGLHVLPPEEYWKVKRSWYLVLETNATYESAEPCIKKILSAIESLSPRERRIWNRCGLRELNIGYDCGANPWAFNNGLSCETLKRIARAGCSLQITLYPPRRPPERKPGGK